VRNDWTYPHLELVTDRRAVRSGDRGAPPLRATSGTASVPAKQEDVNVGPRVKLTYRLDSIYAQLLLDV
jgi:hypothetical protein